MPKLKITLTGFERADFLKLKNAHGTLEAFRTAVAVETLTGENDSLVNRQRAYSSIVALARTGAIDHNLATEMVRVNDVDVLVPKQQAQPENTDPTPSALHTFIAGLRPPRLRCLLAIIEMHERQGGGPLPAHLAGHILDHMRDKYHGDIRMFTPTDKIRQLLFHLRERGFFEDKEHGVYQITPAGLELVGQIKKITDNRAAAETPAHGIDIPQKNTE